MKTLGVMLDCSRNAVMKPEVLKQFVDLLAGMGYNMLQLYTEDTYEIPGEPYFGYMRGRYTQRELKEIDAHCREKGVELIPCIQVLAHLNQIRGWDVYAERFDCMDILLADDEKTYELIDHMFRSAAECFTSRRINVGMDEAHMLGLGRHLQRYGFEDRSEILLRHLKKVSEIAEQYGFTLMMWSDMFIRLLAGGNYYAPDTRIPDEVLQKMPEGVELVYWDYYSRNEGDYDRMLDLHGKFPNRTIFAGGGWTWSGFCPSLRFAGRVTDAATPALIRKGTEEAMITLWGDDGAECPAFSALPALAYFAEKVRGGEDNEDFREHFRKLTGVDYEDYRLLELPNIYGYHEGRPDTSAKMFLYNDPLIGLMDPHLPADAAGYYRDAANRLSEIRAEGIPGLLFRSAACLAAVLEIKYDLGLRTREAYRNGDMDALQNLAMRDYSEAILRIRSFYEAFREQWEAINKPFGFEIQDGRLGGLLKRMEHCGKRLLMYSIGEAENIPELEEDVLPFHNGWSDSYPFESLYKRIISASVFSHE